MKRKLAMGLTLGFELIGALIWAAQRPSSPVRLQTATIVIEPDVGETFAPLPPSAQPLLTFEQAFARYATRNGSHFTQPFGSPPIYLGVLTLPPSVQERLVYGTADPGACGPQTLPGPPPGHCTY